MSGYARVLRSLANQLEQKEPMFEEHAGDELTEFEDAVDELKEVFANLERTAEQAQEGADEDNEEENEEEDDD